ncbi:MAG: TIGR00730 family Rossman fold protein [Pseudomonadota bacterium]
MTPKLCVFCGSRFGANPTFESAAAETGRVAAQLKWAVVYGGGNVGLMGTLANTALAAGGKVIGIIPKDLLAREAGKRDITELHVTESMYERKHRMITSSDAFLVLPGGYGTLDELLEIVTLKQLGYHKKPIILLDVEKFWQPCLTAFNSMHDAGFAVPIIAELVTIVETVDGAFAALSKEVARS